MSLAGRSLVSINDVSNGEVEGILSLADKMQDSKGSKLDLCQGKILASLFFEPSTRTRLSFEAAMQRLGGSVIGAVDTKTTSLSKGESIADMARVVGKYADIIVIRHPWEGAARVAAEYAGVPVINAGDGSHEHPTQTLCDLYTIKKARGKIKGLTIALCGDLKYGRTTHSLAYMLARFGATIVFYSGPSLGPPEYVLRKLTTEYNGVLRRPTGRNLSSLALALGGSGKASATLDAIYVTPRTSHDLALIPDLRAEVDLKGVDALYMTRLQQERFSDAKGDTRKAYPVVDKDVLKRKELKRALVLHPLPRLDEIAREIDADPRSMYFEQAAHGVAVRMALIALLLGVQQAEAPAERTLPEVVTQPEIYRSDLCSRCENPACVSVHEARYIAPEFVVCGNKPLTLRCVYCDYEKQPNYVGNLKSRIYYACQDIRARQIKVSNSVFFDSEEKAQERGFRPSAKAQQR